jgi:hypothetical protein
LTLTPPLNRGEEAGYMIIIQRRSKQLARQGKQLRFESVMFWWN